VTEAAEEIKLKALELSDKDRAELAHLLLVSLDEDVEEGVEAAWDAELDKRVREIDSGQATGRDAFEVLAEMRNKYE
jgi:putative addiction module component (TIGR02574 family)